MSHPRCKKLQINTPYSMHDSVLRILLHNNKESVIDAEHIETPLRIPHKLFLDLPVRCMRSDSPALPVDTPLDQAMHHEHISLFPSPRYNSLRLALSHLPRG